MAAPYRGAYARPVSAFGASKEVYYLRLSERFSLRASLYRSKRRIIYEH